MLPSDAIADPALVHAGSLLPLNTGRRVGFRPWLVPIMVAAAAAILYTWVEIFRYQHFGANTFDLGNQDQAVWGYSRLRIIPDSLLGIPTILGDHFNPMLLTLAPVDWVWNDARGILVAQAVMLAASSLPLWSWAARVLSGVSAVALQAAYLSFWGILAGVVFDFHHVVFAVVALPVAILAVRSRKNLLLWVAVAVALLAREDVALVTATLGIYIAVVERRRVTGSLILVLSVGWFAVVLGIVIPTLRGGPYAHWEYQALGAGPLAAVAFIVTHPVEALRLLFLPVEKARTLAVTLGGWGFTALVSPIAILLLPILAPRFWSSDPFKWSTHFQYTLLAAPVLAFAAIDAVVHLERLTRPGRHGLGLALAMAILAANMVLTAFFVKPLAELGGYMSDAAAAEVQACLAVIPPTASVSATNFLVPHLSHRDAIYLFPAGSDSDFIALDLQTEGMLPTDTRTYLPARPTAAATATLRSTVNADLASGYRVACSRAGTLVISRGHGGGSLSPEIRAFLAGTG